MEESIDKTHQVLFVCTGNYYRSRLAEVYFNHMAAHENLNWTAFSVGTEAELGHNEGPVSMHTIEACTRLGIPLATPYRFPVQISKKYLDACRLAILLNEDEHLPYIQKHFPASMHLVQSWKILDVEYESPETAIQSLLARVRDLVLSLKKKS